MTRTANARIAGFTFLVYIAAGITDMQLHAHATAGTNVVSRLASIAQHVGDIRYSVLLGIVQAFCALVLAVTLYAITCDEDRDLAMLGMTCRVAEGVIGALSVPETLALVWLATATETEAPDPAAGHALAAYLMHRGVSLSATFFAVGSTLFAWLLLRGRMIPAVLAWIGVVASVLLVVCLPLQFAEFLGGPITSLMWLPMLAFEVPLGLWLIVRGVAVPARAQSAHI